MNKKGNILVLVIAVIALLVISWQIADMASRECSLDKDCGKESYCGSDYKCHAFPTITKNNYVPAAFIIGASLIVAAYILRSERFKRKSS